MDLSLFYFAIGILVLLPTADQTDLSIDSCPTSRRLLFFGGFNFSLGEKKPVHVSSLSKSPPVSAPTKHARTDHKQGAIIYVRPQTTSEMGRKVRSYSHLLKPKLFKDEERKTLKKKRLEKKKSNAQKSIKKKNATQHATNSGGLIPLNDQELDRCRALLHIDQEDPVTPLKTTKNSKGTKTEKASKQDSKTEAKKKVPKSTKSSPSKDKEKTEKEKPEKEKPAKQQPAKEKSEKEKLEKEKPEKQQPAKEKSEKEQPAKEKPEKEQPVKEKSSKEKTEKVKAEKTESKSNSNEKKKSTDKPSETQTITPPTVTQAPKKSQTPPSTPPTPPPPPVSQSSSSAKSKREKTTTTIDEPTITLNADEQIGINRNGKNNSVVDRAYHFVRNMFQLSDDVLESNFTQEDDQILSSVNDEQPHQSRKLLSIDDEMMILSNNDANDWKIDILNNEQSIVSFDISPLSYTSIVKRQLLSVKKTKHMPSQEASPAKSKKSNTIMNKPKVGWAYRYRISRYLADQRMKRSDHAKKTTGGGKFQSQPVNKKISSSDRTKFSKRKLLGFDTDDESDSDTDDYEIENNDVVDSVTITQEFVPKRQLFLSKKTDENEEETDNEDGVEKVSERRRMKSYEEITDPIEIVRSYERGLFKPRVGWQFRYRVSRYIDALRENIREDQERLKLGLEAIKRKTPQELSGRRKRVLDKPFESETKEEQPVAEDAKPHVGWRYRYRISKMLEAKARGEYVDDEEEKRKARLDEEKRKQRALGKVVEGDDECVEWEYDILDPELRRVGEEGRRVGWAYRYRIRRKLDKLKQQQAELGLEFDWETLTNELDRKPPPTQTTTKAVPTEGEPEVNKKSVGWKYRYRVSKMLEAQKREAEMAKLKSQQEEELPEDQRLDPELARLTPEERKVGWQYRYRIRRKLEAIRNATREIQAGRRHRKQKQSKEEIIKKVEESLEKILNIDDIDETPFMEYFRRTSSYVLFGLLPTGRKSICLLPLPVRFSFCDENAPNEDTLKSTTTTSATTPATPTTSTSHDETHVPKSVSTKKDRTKKEKRSQKQTVPSRSIKSDTSNENAAEPVKPVTKTPVKTVEKTQKNQPRQRAQPPSRYQNNEQIKHYDEEEEPVKKVIGVESQRKKNKKRFQIIGKEIKLKQKHSTTTTPPPPVTTTTTSIPKITKTPSPTVKPSEPKIVPTTTTAPLRTISEIIQEEASTFVSAKPLYPEEAVEEINEANDDSDVTTTTSAPPLSSPPPSHTSNLNDKNMSDDDDDDDDDGSSSTDTDSDSESTSSEDSNDKVDDDDLSPLKKIKEIYENAKESVHDVFDLQDENHSS